jgi:hypothetical protein
MGARWTLRSAVVAVSILAGVVSTPSAGIAGTPWTIDETPDPGGAYQSHAILATTAISPTDAWAVIAAGCTPTTFLHWDGAVWSEVPGPSPGSCRMFHGMDAVSTDDVWAVGFVPNQRGNHRTLIAHWDGEAWTRIPSPNRGDGRVSNDLYAVSARSATDAWAVGRTWDGTEQKTLTLRWNGERWSIVPSPSPGTGFYGSELSGVSATSAKHAWAVGWYTGRRTLILRWNGQRWRQVDSPNPGQSPTLFGVTSTSRDNAWAAGFYSKSGDTRTLIVRWDGDRWRRVASPNAGIGDDRSDWLNDIAAASADSAYAVGWWWNGNARRTLVLRWNGTAWSLQDSPNVAGRWNELRAVSAVPGAAFAVGSSRSDVPPNQHKDWTLSMHCC